MQSEALIGIDTGKQDIIVITGNNLYLYESRRL